MNAVNPLILVVLGYQINLMTVMILGIIFGLLVLFWKVQRNDKLDFADLLTKDGRKVSLTKLLQLVGGLTATWVIIKLTASATLSAELFFIYLAYVASIEGFSKLMAAKYQYSETSIKDAKASKDEPY